MAEFTKFEEGHGAFTRFLEKVPICIRHLFLKGVIKMLNLHNDNTEYVMVSCKGVKIVRRDMLFGAEKKLLFEAMEKLCDREKQIMEMRYGLKGKSEKTQKEVADMLGISQSYISRLEKKIMKRLKKEILRYQ